MDKNSVEQVVMPKNSHYSFRVLTSEDKIGAMKLLNDTFNISKEFLIWKYELNPDFDPSFAVVALNNGQVVGCAYWLPRDLKISNSTSVRAAQGADLAVHVDHRGHGVGKALIASENQVLENKNVVMSYGFIETELVKHIHGPQIGLVAVPTSTTVYRKYLNCSRIREKAALLNRIISFDEITRAKLANLRMRVSFRFMGVPPFIAKIDPNEICIEEDDLVSPDLKVEFDLPLSALTKSKKRTLILMKALLTRKIRISGSLENIIKLYGILKHLAILFT